MALVPCKECKTEISKTAKTCPSCGTDDPAKNKDRRNLWIVGFITLVFVIGILDDGNKSEDTPQKPKVETRQDKIDKQFSPWDGAHRNLESLLKQGLNDPDSYQHIETTYADADDHLVVKLRYRAKNGFGGMVQGFVLAKVDLDGNVLQILDQQ